MKEREKIQYIYGPNGPQSRWSEKEVARHPHLSAAYADLLTTAGILPASEKAIGFTFFSPSAHQGLYELAFAQKVDTSIEQPLRTQPRFIAADFFGDIEDDHFVPGFSLNLSLSRLTHVTFIRVSADARCPPIQNESIDVIWDRLGALWFAQRRRILQGQYKKEDPYALGDVGYLFDEYTRMLKPHGRILIDAANNIGGSDFSTAELLQGKSAYDLEKVPPRYALRRLSKSHTESNRQEKLKYQIDYASLGWDTHEIGSGETRLLVLKKLRKLP